jgi:hypothetical protein
MPIIEEAIAKFHTELPEEIQLSCEADEVMNPLKELEQSYGLVLSGLVVFVVVGDLMMEEIPDYIKTEFEFADTQAQKLALDLDQKIFKPLLDRINFLNEHPDKEMTLEQEKLYAENIFKKNLLAELDRDPLITASVNRQLFFILAQDLEFRKVLVQSLYENTELISANNITVDGEDLKPTINNWLKDFISRYGGNASDSVSVSAFLINSDNAKKLSNEERDKLGKIIKTYINLKFFPDSMPSDDNEDDDWQIIPYEPVYAEASVGDAEPAITKPEVAPIVNNQPVDDDTNILELKNMLLQYPEGSLERTAIEEEIKNLQNK